MSIFKYPDFDTNLLDHCDIIDDYHTIMCINKYYRNLIINIDSYQALMILYEYTSHYKSRKLDVHSNLFINSCIIDNPLYRYLLTKYPDNNNHIDIAFELSFRAGHFEIIKWFIESRSLCKITYDKALKWCCYSDNNIIIIKWLIETPYIVIDKSKLLEKVFYNSIVTVNIETAKWAIELSNKLKLAPLNIHKKNDKIFDLSFQGKNLNIIKWLYQLSCEPGYGRYSIDYNYHFAICCSSNNLDAAKWLIELSQSNNSQQLELNMININDSDELAFRVSCEYGKLKIAKWLIKLSSQPNYSIINIHVDEDYAFRISCKNGHLDIAKWLLELSSQYGNRTMINIHAENNYAFNGSCMNGHLEVVKWLIELKCIPDNIFDIFKICCIYGHLEVMQLLIETFGPLDLINIQSIFLDCCMFNHFEIAKWLLELSHRPGFVPIDIHSNDNIAFQKCCVKGFLDFTKWFIDTSNESEMITIRKHYFFLYYACCKNGHLESAKYLIELSKQSECTLIEIKKKIDFLFKSACIDGYLNIAKWLIELSRKPEFNLINIHMRDDEVVKTAYNNGYFDLVRWIIKLSNLPEFHPIIKFPE